LLSFFAVFRQPDQRRVLLSAQAMSPSTSPQVARVVLWCDVAPKVDSAASGRISAMNHRTAKIILERVLSSPANVSLPDFDEAMRWVEGKNTIRLLDTGTDRGVYTSQFVAAAAEMRVLRQLLAHGWFRGTTESAQRVLRLLGQISLLDMVSSKGIDLWERGLNKLRQTPPQTQAIIKLSFRYVISILGLLSFAGLLALIAWWFITTRPPT
jgi:hypothetical protein